MLWRRWIVLQFLPQMTHVYAHVVAILRVRRAPDFAQDLTVREHLAGVRDQQAQQAILDRGQVYQRPALVDIAQAQINLDVAELEDGTQSRAGVSASTR